MSELKNCPFCGGAPTVEIHSPRWCPTERVICQNKDCTGTAIVYAETREAAIKAWNTRAPDPEWPHLVPYCGESEPCHHAESIINGVAEPSCGKCGQVFLRSHSTLLSDAKALAEAVEAEAKASDTFNEYCMEHGKGPEWEDLMEALCAARDEVRNKARTFQQNHMEVE